MLSLFFSGVPETNRDPYKDPRFRYEGQAHKDPKDIETRINDVIEYMYKCTVSNIHVCFQALRYLIYGCQSLLNNQLPPMSVYILCMVLFI